MTPKKTFRERYEEENPPLSPKDLRESYKKTQYFDYEEERDFERSNYPSKRGIHNKVRDALFEVGNLELWGKINTCFWNPFGRKYLDHTGGIVVCGSHYCSGCRNRIAINHLDRVKRRLDEGKWIREIFATTHDPNDPVYYDEHTDSYKFVIDEDIRRDTITKEPYRNQDLNQINGVLGICTLRKEDLQSLIKEDKNRWRKINRRLQKETDGFYWIEVAYEIELVNWDYLKNAPESDFKKLQMKFLIERFGKRYQHEPFLYVHFHGLTSLPKKRIHKVFGKEYFLDGIRVPKTNPYTGLYVQDLHKDKSIEKNVKRITSYPFKNAIRYKHSFIGSDFSNGEPFTHEELGGLITLNRDLYGRQGRTLFRSFSNDRSLFHEIEVHLLDIKDRFIEMRSDGRRRWFLGKRYDLKEIKRELEKIANLIYKLNRQKGNISKKSLIQTLKDDNLIKGLDNTESIWWKLELPFPKSSRKFNTKIYRGYWKWRDESTRNYYI